MVNVISNGKATREILEVGSVDSAIFQEKTYTLSYDEEIQNEESLSIGIENESGIVPHFFFGELTHVEDVRLTIHTEIDSEVVAEELEPSNNYIGSDKESETTCGIYESFNSSDTHQSVVFTGEDTEDVFDGYRVALSEGNNLVLDIENLSGNNECSVRLSWIEWDASEVDVI